MNHHKTVFKSTKLDERKVVLQAKLAELADVLNSRSDLVIENSADVLDTIQMLTQRDVLAHRIDMNSRILGDVRVALDNIDIGEYGVCEDCNALISPRRLDAIPWARVCMQCQESRDRSGAVDDQKESALAA